MAVEGFDPDGAFATVEQLQVYWRALSDDEKTRAELLLSAASDYLRALLPEGWQDDDVICANLWWITCNLVMRKMANGACALPLTQVSQTAGSYTAMATIADGAGNWYLRADEKEILGVGTCGVYTAAMEAMPRVNVCWVV